MRAGVRSATTIAVLCGLLFVGALWGWSEATKPFPGKVDPAVCVDTDVAAGEKVYPNQVIVTVLNAGTREGLAGRTMGLLRDQGFVAGDSGNAPNRARVAYAQIWSKDPTSPDVRLVRSWLGNGAKIVKKHAPGDGVVVIVGDSFQELARGRAKVKAKQDATICSPPVG
jgi:hypothetical protein